MGKRATPAPCDGFRRFYSWMRQKHRAFSIDHPDWATQSIQELQKRLDQEVDELHRDIRHGGANVLSEAADVANLACLLAMRVELEHAQYKTEEPRRG